MSEGPFPNIITVESRTTHPPPPPPQVYFLSQTDFSIEPNPRRLLAVEDALKTIPVRTTRYNPYVRIASKRSATIGTHGAVHGTTPKASAPSTPPSLAQVSVESSASPTAPSHPHLIPSTPGKTPSAPVLERATSTAPAPAQISPPAVTSVVTNDVCTGIPGSLDESESELTDEDSWLAPPVASEAVPPVLGANRRVLIPRPKPSPRGPHQVIQNAGLDLKEGYTITVGLTSFGPVYLLTSTQERVKELVEEHLDTSACSSHQDDDAKAVVYNKVVEEFPKLDSYEDRWPVMLLVQMVLKNTSEQHRKGSGEGLSGNTLEQHRKGGGGGPPRKTVRSGGSRKRRT
ncbi:hypothetical protein PQX77_017692 [Marasmius sp. AFHP31]|nr:hypothetical protein PQX77_017692 [Marasmius sp. AFHP31]